MKQNGKLETFHTALRINTPASNRYAALVEMDTECRSKWKEKGVDVATVDYTFLVLSLWVPGCECSVTYERPQDVPLENVLCEHGNYLLLWTEPQEVQGG